MPGKQKKVVDSCLNCGQDSASKGPLSEEPPHYGINIERALLVLRKPQIKFLFGQLAALSAYACWKAEAIGT